MTIYKVNRNLPGADKIDTINSMIIEANGKIYKGIFDINEIETLISQLGIDRQYLRNQGLGNTSASYTNWSHLYSEDGYSIWKITPTSYQYDTVNQVFFDNKLMEARGEATSESATSFTMVQLYNGDSGSGYTNNTVEAGTEDGTQFATLDSTNDYLYFGDSNKFSGIKFEFHTRGSGLSLVVEYWNGSAWTTLTANDDNLDDDTSNFQSDGKISWTSPSDWATTTVNTSDALYYIRISTTDTPTTTPQLYLAIPYTSVIGMLALSSSQILNEEWAWCSYSTSIYITVRNSGGSAYEGNYYIKSSSTSSNLENFFVHNHQYTADYEDSTYATPISLNITASNFNIGGSALSVNYDLGLLSTGVLCMKETTTPTADTNYGKIYPKSDNKLYFQDGAGNEHEVSLAT